MPGATSKEQVTSSVVNQNWTKAKAVSFFVVAESPNVGSFVDTVTLLLFPLSSLFLAFLVIHVQCLIFAGEFGRLFIYHSELSVLSIRSI